MQWSCHLAVLFRCFLCWLFSLTCSLSVFMNRRRCIRNWDWRCRERCDACNIWSNRVRVRVSKLKASKVRGSCINNIWYLPVFSALLGQSAATEPVGLWPWTWNQDQAVIFQFPTTHVHLPETYQIRVTISMHRNWVSLVSSFNQHECNKL